MKTITYEIEWNLERFHWWFVGRRKVLKLLLSFLNIPDSSFILDIGCGIGANFILFRSMNSKVIGVDSEFNSLALAKKRPLALPLVNGDLTRLPFKTNSIDLILALDILEHLDIDTIGIREIYRTLRKKGKAIFTVPAFPLLKGVQDKAGLHRRRYTKKELVRKIEQEGFKTVRSSYFNFLLFLPILLTRRMISLFSLNIRSENEINFPLINFLLKGIFLLEPYVLRYLSFPFGVSIYCIAEK